MRWSGARSHQRPSPASTTSTPSGAPSGSTNAGAAAPDTSAIAVTGGKRSSSRRARSRVGHRTDVGAHGRLHDLVVGQPRLQQQPAGRARPGGGRRRHHPRGARHERERLLGGAVARGEQLLVEVEEGDDVGPVDALQHGLGADDHPLAGDLGRRSR